jgi:hypothetical protein
MTRPDLIPQRGAIAEPLLLEVDRQISAADLARAGDAPKVTVPILQKLRATHHRQALLLAQGKPVREVAMIVGCTPQRLTQLMVDPTFVELVEYYKDQVIAAMLSDAARLQDKLVDVGEMAVDEIRDRLEDDQKRGNMPVGELRKIAELALDRTVAPPKNAAPASTAPATVTINFGTPLRDVSKEDNGGTPMIEGEISDES